MGYSEVQCRLCGVVFNIGRLRRIDEPLESGWINTGDWTWFANASDGPANCTDADGCRYFRRETEPTLGPYTEWRAIANDDESDADYVYESSDGDEDYEFESDDDLVGDEKDTQDDDVGMTDAESESEWAKFLSSNSGITPEHLAFGVETSPFGNVISIETDLSEAKLARYYEHIAGPTCKMESGYNGHHITAEEMRGCNTFQCLVRKPLGWSPEQDDQDFETTSTHFLSGISDRMRSTDSGSDPEVTPARHGVGEVEAADSTWGGDRECMPFHTACLDIFMRKSKQELGKADINGLCAWYENEADYEYNVGNRGDDEDFGKCRDQWWRHADGSEYLAANPVFIPRLSPILRSVVSDDPNFDSEARAFRTLASPSGGMSSDAFAPLPLELRLEVLRHLDPKDIANLRLSSRTFHQLPVYLWREFIQRDMPWLWETWSDQKPYLWTTVSVATLRKEQAEMKHLTEEFEIYRRVIREELPELLDRWRDAEGKVLAGRPDPVAVCEAAALKDLVWSVPADRVNWYQLYSEITRNWNGLKGLKNRRRTWRRVERIMERIRQYREEGKIAGL